MNVPFLIKFKKIYNHLLTIQAITARRSFKILRNFVCLHLVIHNDHTTLNVLLFPPLISPLRHLTHKFIDNFYCPRLCSFSIGQENQRRIIIGLTDKLVRCSLPYTCIHEKLFAISKDIGRLSPCICSQRIHLLLAENFEFAAFMSTYQRSQVVKKDAVDKRMLDTKEKSRYRHKRPDKQLYVPRALRKADIENEVEKDGASTINKASVQMSCMIPKIKKEENSPALLKELNTIKDSKIDNCDIDNILNVEHNNVSFLKTVEDSVVRKTDESVSEKNSNLTFNTQEKCIKDNESHILKISNDKIKSEIVSITTNAEICNEENLCKPIDEKVDDELSSENPEDSWETMFNDDGDCLDPKFIKELCDITGGINLAVAKNDYSNCQPLSRSSAEEFENIVELYGFPVEFSTQDLTSAFSSFQEASYLIKWVDDCHALAIFSSPAIAIQALHLSHPFIKVRPVSEGIKESKEKARFCARLEAHKPRPVTSAVLARRLVSGALGLKVNASKEQRDIERNLLKQAKEKKKLKARQRQDIWNGIVT